MYSHTLEAQNQGKFFTRIEDGSFWQVKVQGKIYTYRQTETHIRSDRGASRIKSTKLPLIPAEFPALPGRAPRGDLKLQARSTQASTKRQI